MFIQSYNRLPQGCTLTVRYIFGSGVVALLTNLNCECRIGLHVQVPNGMTLFPTIGGGDNNRVSVRITGDRHTTQLPRLTAGRLDYCYIDPAHTGTNAPSRQAVKEFMDFTEVLPTQH
jgi:hypothetical protein